MYRLFVLCLVLLSPIGLSAATNATAILLDISKSVPPEDFQQAKVLIQSILQKAGADDTIEIYAFGNEIRRLSAQDLESVQPTESYTMLFDAAYDVAQSLDKIKADRKSIIIISDGKDTKSATILEDTADYVNDKNIAIYGIGVGDAQRKTMERLARLTGGKFIAIDSADAFEQLQESQAQQKTVPAPLPPPAPEQPAPQPAPSVAVPDAAKPVGGAAPEPQVAVPAPERRSTRYLWAGGFAAGALLLIGVGWVLMRATRKEERVCPNCGRTLEAYQTVCPGCTTMKQHDTGKTTPSPDSTFEMTEGEDDPDLIPVELLERKPVTEEMLSKTFVLMETPMLVIRKGRNIGQTFSLNRVYPVSIGRSRVNEIKLDDVTISGQHCRIIPESGKHVLYDLGSTNGTFVNDKRVSKTTLLEGDIIKVGETQFLFKVEQQRN